MSKLGMGRRGRGHSIPKVRRSALYAVYLGCDARVLDLAGRLRRALEIIIQKGDFSTSRRRIWT